ncbi:MAG: alpha/beta hydrolase family protein [Verrucomicrobiota bacterium]
MSSGVLLLASALLAAAPAPAPERPSAEQLRQEAMAHTVEIRSSKDGAPQRVIWWRPETAAKTASGAPVPLLVFLHSWSGGFEQGPPWIAQAKKMGWALAAPDFRGPNRRPEACASDLAVQDVLDAVEYARRKARIDDSRIYLVGGSGGGHMALMMAARAPHVWAGVSSWCPITDLAAWHAESSARKNNYARMLEQSCGGPPGPSTEAEYRRRSPLFHLAAARGVPVDISTGIHDGHTGSVPVSHTLRAFNALAADSARIDDGLITAMVSSRSVPQALSAERQDDPERAKQVLFRRVSGNARVTIFEGGHDSESTSAVLWLSRQRRAAPSDWSVGKAPAAPSAAQEVSR